MLLALYVAVDPGTPPGPSGNDIWAGGQLECARMSRGARIAARLAPRRRVALPFSLISRSRIGALVMALGCIRVIALTGDVPAVAAAAVERLAADTAGLRADWRRTMREALRQGGEMRRPSWRAPCPRPPDLEALRDISGSMSAYSRAGLHFLHALSNNCGGHREAGWGRVHPFTFGTRLTNITRQMRARCRCRALGRRQGRAGLGGRHPHRRGG